MGQALEEGTYRDAVSESGEVRREITAQELGALLSGIDYKSGPAPETVSAQGNRRRSEIPAQEVFPAPKTFPERTAEGEAPAPVRSREIFKHPSHSLETAISRHHPHLKRAYH